MPLTIARVACPPQVLVQGGYAESDLGSAIEPVATGRLVALQRHLNYKAPEGARPVVIDVVEDPLAWDSHSRQHLLLHSLLTRRRGDVRVELHGEGRAGIEDRAAVC